MVEKPVEARERDIHMDTLENVEHSADRFVIGGMQAEGPPVRCKYTNYLFQFAFHHLGKIWAWFYKVFEIRGAENQHFACAIHAKVAVSLARFGHPDPSREIFRSCLGFWVNRL